MKSIDIVQLAANLQQYVDDAQNETIVVTRGGKPCAVLHGVGANVEAAELAHSREFWTMIEQRRNEPTIPWSQARKQLDGTTSLNPEP